jgi:nitric oxide reductase large subunit
MACWFVAIAYLLAFLGNLLYLRTLTTINLKPDFNFLKENPSIKKDSNQFTAWLFISSAAALFISKVDFIMISTTKSLSDTTIYSINNSKYFNPKINSNEIQEKFGLKSVLKSFKELYLSIKF